ncbi:MAG: oligosaccharide flippase family protein [Candidatus Helarchaeota archaeon]
MNLEELEIIDGNSITQKFAKEGVYSVSWLFIFRISGIISTIIIANILLEQQYGIYSVLNSWGLILNYICSMGVPIASAKIISSNRVNNPEKNYSLFGNIILINVINIVLVLIFSIFTLNFFVYNVYNIPFYEKQIFEFLILLTLLKAVIFSLFSLEQGITTGYREFKIIAIIFIIGYSVKIPILYILTLEYQLIGAIFAEIIAEFIICISFFVFLANYFKKRGIEFQFNINKEHLKNLYSLGIPAFLSNLIFIAVNWFGLTMLSSFYSFADVGTFQTSLNIVNLIYIVPYGLISPFLPEITEKYENNSIDFFKTFSKVLKLIILIIIPLIVFIGLFSPHLIRIFYPRYFNLITFYSAFVLLSYIFINSFTLIFFYSFISMGKSKVLISLEACKAVSFFFLILILVPTHGIVGLAYVFLISFLIYAIIYQIVSVRYNFKFFIYPFALLGLIFASFTFYSFIFPSLDISSPIWAFSALSTLIVVSIACGVQLWKDKDCKNFIMAIFNIFKRRQIPE